MKKLLIILLILCTAVFGQNAKPKFVVSVSGELDVNSSDALADIINHAVIKSKLYSVLPNDRQFRETLKSEWKKGNVSDDRIIALAKNAGADYLCFAKITSLLGSNQIAVQLVNLRSEPMEYSNMGIARGRLNDLDYFADKIQEAVDDMLGIEKPKTVKEEPAQKRNGVSDYGGEVNFTQPQSQPATSGRTEPAIQGTIVPGTTLADKLAWLQRSADSHNTYIVEVNANESIAPHIFEYKGAINITVVLRGVGGNRVIRLKSHGTMFEVKENVTFVLDNNITLQGHSGNVGSIVWINRGTLRMNTGSIITGNAISAEKMEKIGSGGVQVTSGAFTMNGGTISGNTAFVGGGVRILGGGSFEMNGGTISGNTAVYGGGVDASDGTFTMNSGTISGNTATRTGGGVGINEYKTFTMKGGTITGNTAVENGGGVCGGRNAIFIKTGGTITGYKSDPTNGNVVKDGGNILARRGYAVYVFDNMRKETTVGPGVNMNSKKNGADGGWDE
jgi:hypothetical protein